MTTPENPEDTPLNEWLFDEYVRVKDALKDLAVRHELVVDNYAKVCQQNDRLRQAGDQLRDMVDEVITDLAVEPSDQLVKKIDQAFQQWGEASV